GNRELPSGRRGRYHLRNAPEPTAAVAKGGELIGIKISRDLMPADSNVQIGILSVAHLTELRREADVVVPPKFPFPAGVNPIPIIVITPSNRFIVGVVSLDMDSRTWSGRWLYIAIV